MNNEQNIDDILKLLKDSVDSDTEKNKKYISGESKAKKMSEEELQRELQRKYGKEDVFGRETRSKSQYDIDGDLLEEFFVYETVEQEEAKTEEAVLAEELENTDITEPEPAFEEESEAEEAAVTIEESMTAEELEALDIAEPESPLDEEPKTAEEHTEACAVYALPERKQEYLTANSPVALLEEETVSEEERIMSLYDGEELEESTEDMEALDGIELLEDSEFSLANEPREEKVFNEFTDAPKEKPQSFKSLILDYGRPDPTPVSAEIKMKRIPIEELCVEEYEDTPDVSDILSDFGDNTLTQKEQASSAMHELMSKLGCEEELENVSPEAIGEMLAEYEGEAEPYDEAGSAERKKNRRDKYAKSRIWSCVRLFACAVLVVLAFTYDLLPVLDVDLPWLADYILYPGSYVLIGMQLVILAAVCLWKPLWEGIKKLTTLYPDIYSMAAVLVIFNFVYDVIIALSGVYEPLTTPMFHFATSSVIFVICFTEFVRTWREAGAFDLYSTDVAKFTLTVDKSQNSIANKMYSGGFDKKKVLYIPTPVSRPKGFTKAMEDSISFSNAVYSGLLFVAPVAAVIAAIVLLIAGKTVDEAAVALMLLCFTALPMAFCGVLLSRYILIEMSLRKRGIALTGSHMIKKYAKASTLCFNDLNMFLRCDTRDIGFVSYEKSQTNDVLAGLQILYSRLGGPMAKVFSNIPEGMRAKRIRVRRITKSGVEATIDRSHILLVGDLEFMKRYGISFPRSEQKRANDKNAILYISLDGKASAKLSARYRVDPIFDMLIERISEEGGHIVIETYDPVINTEFVASLRKKGAAPISVVHKNAADINRSAEDREKRRSDNGILAVSSRLKLVEAVVWCIRLVRIEKISNIIIGAAMGVGVVASLAFAILLPLNFIWQYVLFVYFVALLAALIAVAVALAPKSRDFTVNTEIQNNQTERDGNEQKHK